MKNLNKQKYITQAISIAENLLIPAIIVSVCAEQHVIEFENNAFRQIDVPVTIANQKLFYEYIFDNITKPLQKGLTYHHQPNKSERPIELRIGNNLFHLKTLCLMHDACNEIHFITLTPDEVKQSTLEQAEQNVYNNLNQKLFKALVHDGLDMIAVLDNQALYKYVSPTSKTILNISSAEFIGRSAFEYIHDEDLDNIKAQFASCANKKKITLDTYRFRDGNGGWRYLRTVITDLRHVPEIQGFVANSQDITTAVIAAKEIEGSNERYRYATMATAELIWDLDMQTGSILCGAGFNFFAGYELKGVDLKMESWLQRIHPNEKKKLIQRLHNLWKSPAKKWAEEFHLKNAYGKYIQVQTKAYLIRGENGTPLRMVGALADITKRKTEKKKLRIMKSIATSTIDAVLVAEIAHHGENLTKIIFVNEAFERLTGYSLEEVLHRSPWFLQGSGSDKNELYKLVNSLKNNKPYQGSIINYTKSGKEIWVSYSVTPLADEVGKFTHWVAILRDVSKEKVLEKEEAFLRDISMVFSEVRSFKESIKAVLAKIVSYHHAAFAVLLTGVDSKNSLEIQARFCADSIIENFFDKFIFEKDLINYAQRSIDEGRLFSNESFPWSNEWHGDVQNVVAFPLYDKRKFIGALILGTTKSDLISAIQLQKILSTFLGAEVHRKQMEQDLGQIFTLAPDIIAITDFNGNFKTLNPAASRILGFSHEHLIKNPFIEFLYPDTQKDILKRLYHLRESGTPYNIEERYLTSDGRSKWISWTSQSLAEEQLIYSVGKDVTQQKELEELLSNANSLAKIGSWEVDYVAGQVSWNEITREILEVDLHFKPTIKDPFGNIYLTEKIMLMNNLIKDCMIEGKPWDEVLQFITQGDNIKWLRTIGKAEFISGKCIRLYGSLQDVNAEITAKLAAESATVALEASEKRYSELFHFNPNPMWLYDYETLTFLDVNETAINHYGYSRKEFLSLTIKDLRAKSELKVLEDAMLKNRKAEPNVFQGVFSHLKKNGDKIHVDIKSSIVYFKGRKAKVVVATDITERVKYYDALAARNATLQEIAWVQSHKVRAPLARLMGLADMVLSKRTGRLSTEKIIENMASSANELDLIIREIIKMTEVFPTNK
ncbi:PAS domain S-box protein [Pedobacter aquatilis]|uniref:PAS domain-containing protein n=1 Tax=Pedobacter aquatilis TaxID=351343 RepID=UPI0025B38003|nr:PAS domain S-box protein [Pedobacter aquatilis]MDN3585979.1 PAS domain S-box protein [Pedobacter aquatilis]